ncbi:MAG: DUF1566 domain-containing protein [Flavobacteriales bacterium]|nr:DUF1566 domain-containing protein [Flavobacteriales bacterium]
MAADLCANLTLGSYSDWFLPSKDELYQMYLKIGLGNTLPSGNVGGFSYGKYWSSTEDSAYSAWALDFYEGNQISYGKGNPIYVRAVRTF